MYNHRIFSFVVFTGVFWTVELAFTLLAWLVLSYLIIPDTVPNFPTKRGPSSHENVQVKDEEGSEDGIDELSDTSRTFPTNSRQLPLRYSSPRAKKEEEEEEEEDEQSGLSGLPLPTVEADDEDEDADFVLDRDSGIGTSLESTVDRRNSVRRRSRLSSGSLRKSG